MTAPIETIVEAKPVVVENQSTWEKFTPEIRDQALREGKLPPEETPPEPPEETPPEEPPEKPPTEPPVKVEPRLKAGEPQETPLKEEPVKPEAAPLPAGLSPAEGGKPPVEEPSKRLYAGQYETVEAMENALLERQTVIDRQGGELGELRKQIQPEPPKEPEDPRPVSPSDLFDEAAREVYEKEHDEWLLRQIDKRMEQSEKKTEQKTGQIIRSIPVQTMIEKFYADHQDLSSQKRETIAAHADNMSHAAGKPVSLEEAYSDLFGAKTETPSKPKETPSDVDKAAAIVEANKAPVTVADVPTAPPPDEGTKGQVSSQAEWNTLTETERKERLSKVGMPPAE